MEWWQWIAIGALLLGAETLVDAEFYLVLLGVAAVVVGLVGLTAIPLPFAGQLLLFAALSVFALFGFRGRVYAKLRPGPSDRDEGVIGEIALAEEAIEAGSRGRVSLRGTTWTAENAGDTPLRPQGRARVMSVSGLTLSVWPED